MVSGLSPPSVTRYQNSSISRLLVDLHPHSKSSSNGHRKVLAHIQSLGSTVNWMNSSLQPRQQVNFLGMYFDSVTMNAHLTSEGQQSGKSIKTFPVRKTGECAQITELVLADSSSSSISGDPSGPVERAWHTVLVQFISSPSKKDKGVKLLVTQFCMKALLPWIEQKLSSQRSSTGSSSSQKSSDHNRCITDRLESCLGGLVIEGHVEAPLVFGTRSITVVGGRLRFPSFPRFK